MKAAELKVNAHGGFAMTGLIVTVILGGIILQNKEKKNTEQQITYMSPAAIPTYARPLMRTVKPRLTDGSIIPGWKKYTDSQGKFTFELPSDAEVSIQEVSYKSDNVFEPNTVIVTFNENGKKYDIEVWVGSGRDVPNDYIKTEQRTIAGKLFTVKTFYKGDAPFLISASSLDKNILKIFNGYHFGSIEFTLPPTNTDGYIDTFHQILSTFRFAR
jgi:hypothetical protein